MTTLGEVLTTIAEQNASAWPYLPATHAWTLGSQAAVLESEEVPPEEEDDTDDTDAGIPALAKHLDLTQVLPITVLQEIVDNAREQVGEPSPQALLRAFLHYYDTDAFIEFRE